jgi:hypothetical protein
MIASAHHAPLVRDTVTGMLSAFLHPVDDDSREGRIMFWNPFDVSRRRRRRWSWLVLAFGAGQPNHGPAVACATM